MLVQNNCDPPGSRQCYRVLNWAIAQICRNYCLQSRYLDHFRTAVAVVSEYAVISGAGIDKVVVVVAFEAVVARLTENSIAPFSTTESIVVSAAVDVVVAAVAVGDVVAVISVNAIAPFAST